MKSLHNKFRALGWGMGLALLMVTGTAVLMAALSSAAPAANRYPPPTTPALHPSQHAQGDDSLFYERIAGSDGSQQWVLSAEPDAHPVVNAGPSIYAGGPTPVSYTLLAKPAGLNKAMRNCSRPRVYDIVCITLG